MQGMIAAPEPLAVEAGVQVLMDGGNAVDAAVTCAFVEGIVNPMNCGIGGYLLATLHLADEAGGAGRAIALDAPALAGSKTSPDMWEDASLGPNPEGWGFLVRGRANYMGYSSICTPGAVRGLGELLARHGTISWAEAIAPAVRVARTGFTVGQTLAASWRYRARDPRLCTSLDCIAANAAARRIYLRNDGDPYEPADVICNSDYADTLERLAARGPDDFYTGELAGEIVRDLEASGSFVTAQDLSEYVTRAVRPLAGSYRGWSLSTSPPPHGGPTLLAALNILEGYDLAGLAHNSAAYIYVVSMALKAAFADRNPYLGDMEFVDTPLDWMISKERGAEWRRRIDAGQPIVVDYVAPEPPDTTHVSTVDRYGNCVALTHSLGSGSGVITPGLGFIYNNSMCNFNPLPGRANSIAPRKSRTTGMTPTVVYRDGTPAVVIGAPGGTKIIGSVLQVLLNILDFGMSPSEAVLAPRFDCQGDLITCQPRIPAFVRDEVAQRHPVAASPNSHGGMGLVHVIALDPDTGRPSGGADAGAGGMALLAP
jgi:gamma-glutamyltranspeptidase/glutathione hydrolase